MRSAEERKALVEATRDLSAIKAAEVVGVTVATIYKWRAGPSYGAVMRENAKDARHGTLNGYANYGCRCDRCKLAAHDYFATRKPSSTPG